MRRLAGRVLAGAAVLCAGGGIFACVHNDTSLFIRDVLAQQLQQQGVCPAFTTNESQASISSGILDVALRQQYDAMFLVGNQLVPQSNPQQLREETSIITIRGAVVRITDSAGNQLTTYTRLTSSTVDPAQSSGQPTFTAVSAMILDPATVLNSPDVQKVASFGLQNGSSARFVTFTRFFGDTLGGTSVESDEFEFPIDVCYGCLIGFTNSSVAPVPNCAGAAASSAPSIPCILGQDEGVPCTACQSEFATCNGIAGATVADAGSD